MIEIIAYLFAGISILIIVFVGIATLFINPRDDRDCQSESDLFDKYHKDKK